MNKDFKVIDLSKNNRYKRKDLLLFDYKARNIVDYSEKKIFFVKENVLIVLNFSLKFSHQFLNYFLENNLKDCLLLLENLSLLKKMFSDLRKTNYFLKDFQILFYNSEPCILNLHNNEITELKNDFLFEISRPHKSLLNKEILIKMKEFKNIISVCFEGEDYIINTNEGLLSNIEILQQKKITSLKIYYNNCEKIFYTYANNCSELLVSNIFESVIKFFKNCKSVKKKFKNNIYKTKFIFFDNKVHLNDVIIDDYNNWTHIKSLYFSKEEDVEKIKKEMNNFEVKNQKDLLKFVSLKNKNLDEKSIVFTSVELKNKLILLTNYSKENYYFCYYNKAFYLIDTENKKYFEQNYVNEQELQEEHDLNMLKAMI